MAFENLSDRLQMALRRVTGRGKLNEKDIDEMMRDVRLSLLEADVNYRVVKEFTQSVKEQALGEKILHGLNPGQQVVKIVFDELKRIMGDDASGINLKMQGMSVIMTMGLQGAGKTTAIGKLANYLRKYEKKNPMLIAADIYRPAAVDQLVQIGKQLNVYVYEEGVNKRAWDIVANGLAYAKNNGYDCVIIDTAGRLHIDEDMMEELVKVKQVSKPDEVLLVVDAMTGQDAVNVAKTFHDKLNATGCILTKLDGDTRGGAALSIKAETGKPIKFSGTGEKMEDIEPFHPDRMASRILGMGDVLTLIEKAQDAFNQEEAEKLAKKIKQNSFTLEDYMNQLDSIKKMGNLNDMLQMIPGFAGKIKGDAQIDEKQMSHTKAIIQSMTPRERRNPDLIKSSQKKRIADGSGTSIQEINQLLKQFQASKEMMHRMSKGKGMKGLPPGFKF